MCVIEVYQERFGWGVRKQGGLSAARLVTLEQAEARARWVAARLAASDGQAEIRVVLANGQVVRRWMDGAPVKVPG